MKNKDRIIVKYLPGSDKAIKAGCKCPVLDNEYGRGYMGIKGQYCYSELCPLHKKFMEKGEQ